MQESWFCARCKSMNRAGSEQCYRCKARKSEATLATVSDRQQGVVLTPGLDDEHREIAWTLMFRQRYISAWKLGYLAAGLLIVTLALAVFADFTSLVVFVANGSLDPALMKPPQISTLSAALLALGFVGLVTAVIHSGFLGLTSMDAPALGSGSPRFDPVRAALWWIESALWAIRGGLSFVVPPLLCLFGIWLGGLVLGLGMGIVWAAVSFYMLGDPIANLGKPARLLHDLWNRLGVPGSSDSRIVTMWSAAWGTGRGVEYAVSGLIFVAIIAFALIDFVAARFGMGLTPASQSQADVIFRLIGFLVLAIQGIADGIGLLLLAQITIELSKRQRVREDWVLRGFDVAKAKALADARNREAGFRATAAATEGSAATPVLSAGVAAPMPAAGFVAPPEAESPAASSSLATGSVAGSDAPSRVAGSVAGSDAESPADGSVAPPEAAPVQPPLDVPHPGPEVPPKKVIKPSSQAVSKYRTPTSKVEEDRPPESPPNDLDLGGGI